MIQSFADRRTERLFLGQAVPSLGPDLSRQALKRLLLLHAADELGDLRFPPGNRLEPLLGDRAGYYSIRVNRQFRLVFEWGRQGPGQVELVDYH